MRGSLLYLYTFKHDNQPLKEDKLRHQVVF